MNLILNNIIILTNSQSLQEKLDNNHELKKFLTLKVIMMMMFPYILYNLYKPQSNKLQYKLLTNLNIKLSLIHYQFPKEELYKPQLELQWSQLLITNNLWYHTKMSTDFQLLDKVKECKCHLEQVTCQFTELQLVIIKTL